MDTQRKAIENLQSARKGEMSAIAKYKAISKSAEEVGYQAIALPYNIIIYV